LALEFFMLLDMPPSDGTPVERFERLGDYSGFVAHARAQAPIYPGVGAPPLSAAEVRSLIGWGRDADPVDIRSERRWTNAGLAGEEVSWSAGYGPRTHAWVLRPAQASEPLPGVLALHGHDGFKFFGKEKIADGPDGVASEVHELRDHLYEGVAFANALAARGFCVLVHDAFLWGSRRFAPELLRPQRRAEPEALWLGPDDDVDPHDAVAYNRAALRHEHVVAKYCTLLGTSLSGVIAFEDRIAVRYLRSRRDVIGDKIGCIGLSGGGCRSALLQATCDDVSAAAVIGMMTTHPALLDRLVANHTWMFFPPGLALRGDWPDLAAARAPSPLLVQFNREDQLFTPAGMEAGHRQLRERYRQAGAANAYVGEFYDGPHKFDRAMQGSAFAHLERWLGH
jgi:dienelactone hydrolase